ncbi:hypothetical protein ACMSI6_01355 [Pseudomonas antarctica]|uniref:hypothetical protein n=1 Tax=Pseudomonas antarctica TaxID=219572 RepID=UPI0039C0085C
MTRTVSAFYCVNSAKVFCFMHFIAVLTGAQRPHSSWHFLADRRIKLQVKAMVSLTLQIYTKGKWQDALPLFTSWRPW